MELTKIEGIPNPLRSPQKYFYTIFLLAIFELEKLPW